MLQTPAIFIIRGVNHQLAQIMQIGTLCVRDGSKNAFFNHVEDPQFFAIVTAIFQHDAMALCGFRCSHQFNRIFGRVGDGHFRGRVQSVFHGL